LASIGSQVVDENISLLIPVSAADPDGATPVLTTSTLPGTASFIDNGNGTGSFNWTPSFDDAGLYFVTFYATDAVYPTAIDSEIVSITVNNVNQPPVLAAIGPKSTTENIILTFGVSATDADGTVPVLSSLALPTGASFTDNLDGTGTFDWTPDFLQSGVYNVTFYADDGVAIDSEEVAITVIDAGNQNPVLAAIGPQSTTENINLAFGVSATDIDGASLTLFTSTLPSGALFTDNGDGTGSFDWTPDYLQSGGYDVTFYATDDSSGVDSELVTITVIEAGNQYPVLSPIGSQSTTEGIILNIAVNSNDAESIPALTTSSLPGGAVFLDNGDGTGDFNWTPGFTQDGIYNITFYATDDSSAVDSEIVAITVADAGNQPPVLASIGSQSTTENINLTFGASASDPDLTTPSLSAADLPTGASFVDNGNGTGTFDWTPDYIQSGIYNITIIASDGALTDSEVVAITVIEAGNQNPILATIGSQSTTENINLVFGVSATDPESVPTLATSTLPTGASFVDNGDGTGTFDWTPDYTQSGSYDVTFYATDDSSVVDSEQVNINVTEAGNQPPVLAAIGPQGTTESINLNFTVTADDPDGTTPALSATDVPTGATYTDNGDGTGTFNWTPGFTDAGIYNVTFIATDGSLSDSELVVITVNDSGNQPPVLASIGSQSTTENINLTFGVSATDPDLTTPSLSAVDLPTGANFVDNGDGTGDFDWTPDYTQSGIYNVTFIASDGSFADSELVVITVNEVGNQNPVLAAIGSQGTTENINLNFGVSATDPESTPTLTTSALPTGVLFVDNGNGTGSFDWTPDYTQSGSYDITFYATDDSAAVDSEVVNIDVIEAGNQAPILAAIGNQAVTEGDNLNLGITAIDPDGTTPALTATGLPSGASFIDNGNGTGTFDWTPGYTQAGVYNVTFTASDGSLTNDEIVEITVLEAGNQSPILASIGSQSTTENINLNFGVSASDPDGTTPSLQTSALPANVTFTDNGDGSGVFDWTPDYTQSGIYNITFYASDGFLIDSEIVQITVIDAGNQSPILNPIGAQNIDEGADLNLVITSLDPDGTIPTLTTSALPTGAAFIDNGNGFGNFDWTPDYTQAGSYDITFYATDAAAAVDSEIVNIVVNQVNLAPVLTSIGAQSVDENVNLNIALSATDADGTTPVLTTSTLPTGAAFVDNGNGTGSFDWIPDYTQSGLYDVTFYASDDSAAVDSEVVTITVNQVNLPPVLDPVGARAVDENQNLNFTVTSSDPDGTIPGLTTSALPANAGFIDNGNGTGSFNFDPDFTQSGIYDITFYATDGQAQDSEIVTITVHNVNQWPILNPIGAKSVDEGQILNFAVTASDPDATIPSLSTSLLPTNATFVDNGDGSGVFDFSPDFDQSGIHNITFYASDGIAIDSEIVAITVNHVNQPPVLATIGNRAVNENENLNFNISATDIDGEIPGLTTSSLPTNASFVDNGNGTGTFNFDPDFVQSGA